MLGELRAALTVDFTLSGDAVQGNTTRWRLRDADGVDFTCSRSYSLGELSGYWTSQCNYEAAWVGAHQSDIRDRLLPPGGAWAFTDSGRVTWGMLIPSRDDVSAADVAGVLNDFAIPLDRGKAIHITWTPVALEIDVAATHATGTVPARELLGRFTFRTVDSPPVTIDQVTATLQ